MHHRNRWPLLVIVLVAGFLGLSAWSFHRAARNVSAVTDADYYSHGLRYNQTQLEHQAAATLGWETKVALDGRQLSVTVTDRARQAVTSAQGLLTLVDGTRGEVLRLPLIEDPPGSYRGELPPVLHGEQTAQLDFEHRGARLSQRLLLSLP